MDNRPKLQEKQKIQFPKSKMAAVSYVPNFLLKYFIPKWLTFEPSTAVKCSLVGYLYTLLKDGILFSVFHPSVAGKSEPCGTTYRALKLF